VARNLIVGILLCLTFTFLAGTELTYINGTVAALILSSAAVTALLVSSLRMKGGAVAHNEDGQGDLTGPELVAAAQRYLMSRSEEQLLELEGFGMKGKVRGRRIFSDNTAMLLIFAMFAAFMYYHHTATLELLSKNLEATVENTYVLSLSPEEREKLRITMPESLKRKIRRE
jgi:hypothetical protein